MRRPGLLLLILLPALITGCGFGDRSDILLLVRAGDPVSLAIAQGYAGARKLPPERILELALSTDRHATEIDSETYLREIAEPIERHLRLADPDAEITILITTSGLPMRIGHCDPNGRHYPRDCRSAAVDAALAQLGRTGDDKVAFRRVENPFFRDPRSFDRFRRESPGSALRFLVARLTAAPPPKNAAQGPPPTPEDTGDRHPPAASKNSNAKPLWRVVSREPRSRRTVASAALLDSIEDRLPSFGHRVCDGCSASFEEKTRAIGVVLQSDLHEKQNEPAPPRLAYPGFVIRLDGTPTGPGGDGKTLSPFDLFATRWFALGAGAISTHIADPSLADVTRPTEQLTALARGSLAIEAHFKSVPQLGWVNVFVGDPLLVLPAESVVGNARRDQDRDGIVDAEDNCRDDPNADQRDTNNDGLGNLCVADVNDDGIVETSGGMIYPVDRRGDLEAISLTARNGPYDPDHDLDGDGRVDERDLILAQLWLFRTPGRPADR